MYWCTVASAVPTASDRRAVVEVRSSRVSGDLHRHSPLLEVCRQE